MNLITLFVIFSLLDDLIMDVFLSCGSYCCLYVQSSNTSWSMHHSLCVVHEQSSVFEFDQFCTQILSLLPNPMTHYERLQHHRNFTFLRSAWLCRYCTSSKENIWLIFKCIVHHCCSMLCLQMWFACLGILLACLTDVLLCFIASTYYISTSNA
jgi:hypothetical protein